MTSSPRDIFIAVPSDRCLASCSSFSSCFKLRGYSQPHVCLPWGANDEDLYAVLLGLIVFILLLLIGGSIIYIFNRCTASYKKKHTGGVDLVAMRQL